MKKTRPCSALTTRIVLFSIATAVLLPPARAEHRVLWEWGTGLGTVHAPIYRGARQTKDYTIPIPFLRYRGRFFAADEDGLRGKIFENQRLKLDISIAGSVPVPKSDTGPRENMPSLDPIGEFGPAINYLLWRTKKPKNTNTVSLELPIRTVFSVGNPVLEHQGWAISPHINWLQQYRNSRVGWRVSISAGPLFADSKYHNYFYQVEPRYSNVQRSTYNAGGGYSGSRITFSVSRNSERLFLGFFARFDDLHNAAFIDSPLVETEQYGVFGFAAVWIISKSDTQAPHWP